MHVQNINVFDMFCRLTLNRSGGQCLDEKGTKVRRWRWNSLSPIPTPLHPVFLSLNKSVGVRVLGEGQVFVSFLARGQQAKFSVGTCDSQVKKRFVVILPPQNWPFVCSFKCIIYYEFHYLFDIMWRKNGYLKSGFQKLLKHFFFFPTQDEWKPVGAVSGPSVLQEELFVSAAQIRIHLAFQHLHKCLRTPSRPWSPKTRHASHLRLVSQRLLASSRDATMSESDRAFIDRCLQDCL